MKRARVILALPLLLAACEVLPPDNNQPSTPSVTLRATATEGNAPFEANFFAQATPEARGYTWTIAGERQASSAPRLEHIFETPGLYVVTVTATTSLGAASDSLTVRVSKADDGDPPPPSDDLELSVAQTPGGPAPWAVRYRAQAEGYEAARVRAKCSEDAPFTYGTDGEVVCLHTTAEEEVYLEVLTKALEPVGSATVASEVGPPEDGIAFLGTWRYLARGTTESFTITQGTETAGSTRNGAFKLFVIKQKGSSVAEFTFGGRTVVLEPTPEDDGGQAFFAGVYDLRLERLE